MPRSEQIQAGGMTIQFHVEADDSNGSVSVFRATLPVGARQPVPHSHDAFEETNIGVRGVVTFTVDGTSVELGCDATRIPRGAVHGFVNKGTEGAEILSASTPALFSPDYFREMAAVIAAAGNGPPDRAAIMDIQKRHGLTPAIPA